MLPYTIDNIFYLMKKGKNSYETPSKVGSDSELTTANGHSRISSGNRFSVLSDNLELEPTFLSYRPLTKHLGIKS